MGEPWVVVIPKRLSARLRERSIFFVVFVFSPENFRSVPLSTLGFSSGLWEEAGGGSELIARPPLLNLKAEKVGHVGRTHFPSSSVPASYLENPRRSRSSVKFRKPMRSPLGAGEPPPQLPERSFCSTSKYVSTVGREC